MASEQDTDINKITWSSKGYPLYELIAKFPLPIIVKSANTSRGDGSSGRIVAHELYRIRRMVRLQKIRAQILPNNTDAEDLRTHPVDLSIPKNYRGLFQMLPYEKEFCTNVKTEDILKYRPRYLKVAERIKKITTGAQIELSSGDELEMLGVRKRATKTGVKDYLKLRKNYREFVLNPDCEGRFFVAEDDTHYILAEILERFPLPQKVSLVNAESHSEVLLKMLASKENLLLKDESQDEYIVGEDISRKNGIIVHTDASLFFYIPDSVTPTYADGKQAKATSRKSKQGDSNLDELVTDQIISMDREKHVVCKPIELVFKNLNLPPRTQAKMPSQFSVPVTGPHCTYDNVELQPAISKRDRYGKLGSGLTQANTDMPDRLPPIPPKPVEGKENKYNVKLLTPEETRSAFDTDAELQEESSPDYDYPDHEIGGNYFGDAPMISDNDSDSYEEIPESQDFEETTHSTNTPEVSAACDKQLGQEHDIAQSRTCKTKYISKYVNSSRPEERQINPEHVPALPLASAHHGKTSDIPFHKTSDNESDTCDPDQPPKLPPRPWETSSKNNHPDKPVSRQVEPRYQKPPPSSISRVFKGSVRGVESLHTPSPDPDVKPDPPPRQRLPLPPSPENLNDQELLRKKDRRKNSKETWMPPTPLEKTRVLSTVTHTQQPLPDICSDTLMEKKRTSLHVTGEVLQMLSVDQVIDVLKELKFNNDVQERFRESGIDGELFCTLDNEILQEEFGLSQFHALKIVKFIGGWRPNP